jgi:tetratricopeptide (TPR) repeat protein
MEASRKTLLLGAALPLSILASPAAADVPAYILGGSAAQTCYVSAAERRHDQASIRECTSALDDKTLTLFDRAGTLVNRGIIYLFAGNSALAVRDFDDAIALDPLQAEAWLDKAVAYVNAGNSASALELADHALKLRTQKPALAYYVRGLAYEQQGQLRSAYASLQTARRLAPEWNEPRDELSRYRIVGQ